MNESTAKKIGEVVAFLSLVIDTHERARNALLGVVTPQTYDDTIDNATTLKSQLTDSVNEYSQSDVMTEKSGRTLTKISKARDDYIGDSWDDPVEVYEWFSFNAGAGSAHAAQTLGASEQMGDTALQTINNEAIVFFDNLLDTCKEFLHAAGKKKAENSSLI